MTKMIPYGITDFDRIQQENYYYVDKTMFIERIERQPPYLFVIRPRRFGKSLTLSMLTSYYDISYAGRFEELFGHLYIGKHPTRLHNKFLILRFNFSEVSADIDKVQPSFKTHCCNKLMAFIYKYEHLFGEDIYRHIKGTEDDPGALFSAINTYASIKGKLPIYLFIDEYDNFTNTILSSYGTEHYRKATHGAGYIRAFFNVIKAATTGSGAALERLFITGVSPITMDDVTSGFNIGTNITTNPLFNSLTGFSRQEVTDMLTYYRDEGFFTQSAEEMLEVMKPNYDNYCFSQNRPDDCMFNSDMVLYFINHYFTNGTKPDEMIDPNIRTDFNKLFYLINADQKLGGNLSVLREIAEKGEVEATIVSSFSVLEMTKAENFTSLLFYFGLLSIKGVTISGNPILGVPNFVVREQLFNFIVASYQKYDLFKVDMSRIVRLAEDMAFAANWQPLFTYLADAIREQSSIREFIEGEAHIKGFLLAYLGMFRYYELYPEYEANKGFADFFFKPSPAAPVTPPYTYLLEVKYCKADGTDAVVRRLADDAREQLLRYSGAPQVAKARSAGTLKLITIVWRSWELALMEEVKGE